jgi:hypothetical protein
MRRVFVHTMMSLDGFIAGPNDDMSWVLRHAGEMPGAVVRTRLALSTVGASSTFRQLTVRPERLRLGDQEARRWDLGGDSPPCGN